jgi:hypothetical protein
MGLMVVVSVAKFAGRLGESKRPRSDDHIESVIHGALMSRATPRLARAGGDLAGRTAATTLATDRCVR